MFNLVAGRAFRALTLGRWKTLRHIRLEACNLLADLTFPRTDASSAFTRLDQDDDDEPATTAAHERLKVTYDLRRPSSSLSAAGGAPVFPPTFLEYFVGLRLDEGLFGPAGDGAGGVRKVDVVVGTADERAFVVRGLARALAGWAGRTVLVCVRVLAIS